MCMSVDFPDPDGPMIATNSPSSILKDTPLSAVKEISPFEYVFVIFFSSIMLVCACCR